MGTVSHTAYAEVPVGAAFAFVDDYRFVPEWFFGMTRFDPVGEQHQGLGARYSAALRVGPKELESVLEITTWEQDALIELESVEGFSLATRWAFAPQGTGTTLTVDFTYDLPAGLLGTLLAPIVEPFAQQVVAKTEANLRERLESASSD